MRNQLLGKNEKFPGGGEEVSFRNLNKCEGNSAGYFQTINCFNEINRALQFIKLFNQTMRR